MTQKTSTLVKTIPSAIDQCKIHDWTEDDSKPLTRQYGSMKFDNLGLDAGSRVSQYIRLHHMNSAESVVRFMKEGWQLPTPDLIISVTGGAKNFDMSARLRKIFQRGLVAAAVTTNAWLITAGTNTGVVKEVGEALSNYRYKNRKHGSDVVCMGIGSWGYTAGNDQLIVQPSGGKTKGMSKNDSRISQKGTSNQSATYLDMTTELVVRNYIVKNPPPKRCDLEPNHSHFLLFHDGQNSADSVLSIRAEIEKCSRRLNGDVEGDANNDSQIPIVLVVVEGGPSTCRTICQALQSDTPVVVVKESGRAADLVADLYACYAETSLLTAISNVARPTTGGPGRAVPRENNVNEIIRKVRENNNAWVDEIKDSLCDALSKKKHLVTIFKFDSQRHHGNLEDAILESLLNATKVSTSQNAGEATNKNPESRDNEEQRRRKAELKLAMAWGKFDYAKTKLLTDRTISAWNRDDLRRALFEALRRGHVDFVELLIEFGSSLEQLTYGDLKKLYGTTFNKNRLPVKGKAKQIIKDPELFYKDYFQNYGNLKVMENSFTRPESPDSERQNLLPPDNSALGENAARDLFFWSIFMNQFELATYLCSKTWNSSIAPLFGAHIYRRAARLVLDADTKKEYEDNADTFDNHAMSIIDRCFDNDENFAVNIVKRHASAFADVEPLRFAQKAKCRSFLASKCVQRHLDNTWFGCINYKRRLIDLRVFLCSLFLPLFPIFCFLLPYVRKHDKLSQDTDDFPVVEPETTHHKGADDDEPPRKNPVSAKDKLIYFYSAPIVRFYYYMIFFIVFLGLFSFVLLVDYFPLNTNNGRRSGYSHLHIPITEIILHICIWSLITEEMRQLYRSNSRRTYFSEIWTIIDIVAIVVYLVGFITRFIVYESLFTISKIFLCIDLVIWFVRTLNLFAAYEKLGPKLIMIFNTMKDLLFFVCFIFIFLMAFSITSWSLLTTNDQVTWTYDGNSSTTNYTLLNGGSGLWSWQLIRNVTNYGVWKIFGQVDPIDGQDAYSAIAFVLAILFLAIANVLLLNVLVALFNVTIQTVQSQSHKIWRYQRYVIVQEYYEKPPLPPPFNNIYYIYALVYKLIKSCQGFCGRRPRLVGHETERNESPNSNPTFKVTDAMQRESAIAEDYWRSALKTVRKDTVDVSLQNIERQLQDLKDRMGGGTGGIVGFDLPS